jgi:mercuric ion binding protein
MMLKAIVVGALSVGAAAGLSLCDLCGSGDAGTTSVSAHAAYAATVGSSWAADRTGRASELETVTLKVEGMTCGGCVIGVRKVLTRLDGVSKADVSYETQRAVVTYDPAKVTVQQMIAAIKTLGYKATPIQG